MQCLQQYKEHKEPILALQLLGGARGHLLASCDHALHIWDVNQRRTLVDIPATQLHGLCLHVPEPGNTLLIGILSRVFVPFLSA